MENPYESLSELEWIDEILDFDCKRNEPIEQMYRIVPHILVPVLLKHMKDIDGCFSQVIRLCLNKDNNTVNICQGYDDIEMRCDITEHRFIIYYIDLTFIENERVSGRHSETVLIDTLFETIEFFEPNGPGAPWYSLVNSYLEFYFRRILPDYKYLSTMEFCPLVGPQAKAELPVCGAFSLLFLLLRINNEDYTSGEVIKTLINTSKSGLEKLMYKFICYVVEFAVRHKLLQLQHFYDKIVDNVTDREIRQEFDELYIKLDLWGLKEKGRLYSVL